MNYHSAIKRNKLIQVVTWIKFKMHYAKRKKPDSKGYMLYDPTYLTFWKGHYWRDRDEISGCQGMGVWQSSLQGDMELLGVMGLLFILTMVVTVFFLFKSKLEELHIKRINFTICKLYIQQENKNKIQIPESHPRHCKICLLRFTYWLQNAFLL